MERRWRPKDVLCALAMATLCDGLKKRKEKMERLKMFTTINIKMVSKMYLFVVFDLHSFGFQNCYMHIHFSINLKSKVK